MKYRPMLFSAPMVRALLDGSKTQTRRVVSAKHLPFIENISTHFLSENWEKRPLPHGKTGDRIWVREAYRAGKEFDDWKPSWLEPSCGIWHEAHGPAPEWMGKLRPSMFMPRWASRITLEITGVKVERLHDIDEADAIAEGISKTPAGFWSTYGLSSADGTYSARYSYRCLWESINGPDSWTENPWVWAISFKRIQETGATP